MKQRKKLDLTPYAPVGFDAEREWKVFWGSLTAAGLFSCFYLYAYWDAWDHLFSKHGFQGSVTRTLREGAIMPDFVELLDKYLWGFVVVALCMAAYGVYHYLYHYQGSKSIYLMRRLPDRWELHRRCLTLPVAGIVISMLCMVVCLLLFYWVYMTFTPASCLMPDQWQKLWRGMR